MLALNLLLISVAYRKHGFLNTRLKVKSRLEYGRFLWPGIVQ